MKRQHIDGVHTFATRLTTCGRQRPLRDIPGNDGTNLAKHLTSLSQLEALSMHMLKSYNKTR